MIGKIFSMPKCEWRFKKKKDYLSEKRDTLCFPVLAKSFHHLFYFELSPVWKRHVSLKYLQPRLIWDAYRGLLIKIIREKKGERKQRI